jgi:hypothetical protein
VFTEIPERPQSFKAYYQDNSLLIQFVINEFLHVHEIIHHLKKCIDNHQSSLEKSDLSISSVLHFFNQLLGTHPQQEHITISKWIKGPLTKMKDYCEQFSKNHSLTTSHLKLYEAVYQAWNAATHQTNTLKALQLPQLNNPKFSFSTYFQRSFKQLLKLIEVVSKQIPKVTNLYWDNENVIYFLIRKKDRLIQIYGEEFTQKNFKSFAQQNILLPYLIQRYQQRGFQHLNIDGKPTIPRGLKNGNS